MTVPVNPTGDAGETPTHEDICVEAAELVSAGEGCDLVPMIEKLTELYDLRARLADWRWIPVAERMPEKDTYVTVLMGRVVYDVHWDGELWWHESGSAYYPDQATHWHKPELPPLPVASGGNP